MKLATVVLAMICIAHLMATAQTFKITTTPRTQTVQPDQWANYHLEITPVDGFMATVYLHVVPSYSAAFFPTPHKLNYPYTGGSSFGVRAYGALAGTHSLIIEGWNGSLWVRDTVYLTVPETRDVKGWHIYNTSNSPLPDNELTTLALDRDNNGWMGTAKGRVVKFDRRTWNVHRFYQKEDSVTEHDLPVQALIVDTNNNMWMGWNGGVRKFTGEWSEITGSGSELKGSVNAIAVALDQTIWFAVEGNGLIRYNSSGWSRIPYSAPVTRLAIDRNGNPCTASPYGVGIYDGTFWSNFTPRELGISRGWVGGLHVDAAGDVWMAGGNAVVRWRNGERTVYDYSPAYLSVNAIDFDASGNLWMATTGGLVKYDFTTLTAYTTNTSAIPNNNVTGVKVDRDGLIWVATAGGLALLDQHGVLDVPQQSAPTRTNTLYAAMSPNPITRASTIQFRTTARGPVRASLVNSLGRETAVVFDGDLDAGDHAIAFDATGIPAGTYFLRVSNGAHVLTLPVMVLQ